MVRSSLLGKPSRIPLSAVFAFPEADSRGYRMNDQTEVAVFSDEDRGKLVNYFARVHYEPSTGIFTWAVSARGISAGKVAGSISIHGYRLIKLGRKPFRAGRLAWFLTHGEWPSGEIDHINGNKLDDRIANLRVVDRAGNSQNKGGAQKNNKSCGLLGVTWNKQHRRWQSKIMANGIRYHVGYFNDPHEASAAYMEAKSRLHIGGRSH
jgi:hypothetical protein